MNYVDFKNWLRTETNLLDSSINLYVRIIKEYKNAYENDNEVNLKDFINKSFKRSHSSHKKYAFKLYLRYIGKESLYKDLPKVRKPSKKKWESIFQKILFGI